MTIRIIAAFLALTAVTLGLVSIGWAQEEANPVNGMPAIGPLTISPPSPGLMDRDTLTGDWDGLRPWLKAHGIILKPRLTQFYQGMPAGDDAHGFEYGGKADLLLNADLSKFQLWKGLSLTIHGEYNFGESVNGRGGTIAPVNTAL